MVPSPQSVAAPLLQLTKQPAAPLQSTTQVPPEPGAICEPPPAMMPPVVHVTSQLCASLQSKKQLPPLQVPVKALVLLASTVQDEL